VLRQFMDEVREQIGDEIGMDDLAFRTDNTVLRYAETMAATHVSRSQRDLTKVLQLSGLEDDIETQLLTTVESWMSRRVNAIGIREATKAGGFFALTSMLAAGVRRMGWRAVGQSCPLCLELDGTIVSIEQAFRKQGDIVDPRVEGTKPLVVQTLTRHPPLHAGCDCVIIPAA
jgi:hypothetical protein